MGTVLGIDYGRRRIGIAVSDPTRTVATGVAVHRTPEDGSVFAALAALARERDVERAVVGLPLTADGREGDIAARARAFADRLADALGLPVELVDERYSSREADRWLRASGRRDSRAIRRVRDAVAAELILQQYLDGARKGET